VKAKMKAKLIVGLVLVALVMIFTLQNTEVVTIQFLFGQVTMSRALILFIVLIIGMFLGWLVAGLSRRRR